MILETIVSTRNKNGSLNIAPMGPVIEDDQLGPKSSLTEFDLRPFDTSTTFKNIQRTGCGVLHITDDVRLFAAAAIGKLQMDNIETMPASEIEGDIIANSCRWHEFKVIFTDTTRPRTIFKCRVVNSGRVRDFIGFNRAKHAIIETAILATRIDFLPADVIANGLFESRKTVDKTGGEAERETFRMLEAYLEEAGVVSSDNRS